VLLNLNFVQDFWELHEPTGAGGFDKLDRYLLRSILQHQHTTVNGDKNFVLGAISQRFAELPRSVRAIASQNFLTGVSERSDPNLLARARSKSTPAGPLDMLARSFLLLRTATALTHSSFAEAGVSSTAGDLRPWLDMVATDRGFRNPNHPYQDPSELWHEVAYALDDFKKSKKPTPSSLAEWIGRSERGMPVLTEVERVGVWSFGS
jgi:hypothetical protein